MERVWIKITLLIRILSFCLIFIFLFTLLSYMAKPIDVNLESIAGIYSEKKNSLDVVSMGGSVACVYYAPLYAWDKYGIVSYDYGANSFDAELYKYYIKELLKTQHPKLIIIDVRPLEYDHNLQPEDRSINWGRNPLKGMKFSLNKINCINKNIYKKDYRTSYYFDFIMYHGNIIFSKDKLDMMFGRYKNKFNGFNNSYCGVKSSKQNDFKTEEISKLSQNRTEIIIELLDYIKTTDVNYLFVVVPSPLHTKERKRYFNYIEHMIRQYGYNFLDTNEYTADMQLDFKTDFNDGEHVNIYGTEKYTDFLCNYILNNYDIISHKNDKKYEYMNDNLELWNDEINKEKNYINGLIKR